MVNFIYVHIYITIFLKKDMMTQDLKGDKRDKPGYSTCGYKKA